MLLLLGWVSIVVVALVTASIDDDFVVAAVAIDVFVAGVVLNGHIE